MPQWKYNLQGFKDALRLAEDDERRWPEARDKAVQVLLDSKWYRDQGDEPLEREYSDLGDLIAELKASDDIDWADEVIERIYDLADDERVWLGI